MNSVQTTARKQRGQALTEFLVASLAILPLLLLIPVIAKYQDINHTTLAASRYVAFDATTRNDINNNWKSEQQQADEVRRRFFSNPDAPIKTHDAAGNFKAHQNLFWRTPRNEPLIKDVQNDIAIHYGNGSTSQPENGFTKSSDTSPFVLASNLDLNARGLFTPHVEVHLANLPSGLKFYEPFDALNLRISRSTTLLIDPWSSRSAQATENKLLHSTAIFPAGPLQDISRRLNMPITLIELPGNTRAPLLGQLDFWRDIAPADRLKERQ